MGEVKIYGDKAHEAQAAAKALEQSIASACDQCEALISFLHSAKWRGKSRDAFLTYIEIIHKYNKDLKSALIKQTKAIQHLEDYINDFERDPSVREVKHL
ncbi:WXG100 family type VII secretion target [Camelliibacillus cellulosilyticus]|uniref:WXG100 family type VII secretion target n=1 Tax=Camelliibacillus cellulosilyticus TaxID=2174486 RepID=A0ABV9GS01_9BACL